MRIPIFVKLAAPLAAIFAGIAALGAWIAGSAAERAALAQVAQHAQLVLETLERADFPLTDRVLAQVRGFSGFELAAKSEGGRLVSTVALTADQFDAWFDANAATGPALAGPFRLTNGTYSASTALLPAKSGRPATRLAVLSPRSTIERALAAAKSPPIAIFLLGDLAAVVLVIWMARKFSARIRRIESRSTSIAAGARPGFSPSPPFDELTDLETTLELLSDRLLEYRRSLSQTERMQLLSQLAGGMAHRLRNGVTGARLALQLYQRESGEQERREAVDVALRQLSLVESHVLQFLRSDLHPPEFVPVDFSEIVRTAAALIEPKAAHLEARIELLGADGPVRALGDAASLERAINVLLENGLEAAGPEGRIRVELKNLDSGVGDRIVLRVVDSGKGPSPELAETLFEPFATDKPGGIGLGLHVARTIARAHGGELRFVGCAADTTFELELPALAIEAPTKIFDPPAGAAPAAFEWSVRT